jgi:PAS domain S-box-containing protein
MVSSGSPLFEKAANKRVTDFIFRPRPVRKLLILMALALLTPALGFTSYLVARSAAAQREQAEQRLVQVASDLANDIDRDFNRMFALLETLALSQLLSSRDYEAFHAQAVEAVNRLGANVLIVDRLMRQQMNTRVPYGTPLPEEADPDLAGLFDQAKDVQVTNLLIGRISKRPVFNIIKSLATLGQPGTFLVLAIDANHLLQLMGGLNLPTMWVTGVSDLNGVIVARSAEHDSFVGRMLPANLRDPNRSDGGTFTNVNVKGEPVIRALATSKVTSWLVSANLPQSALDADVRRSMLMLVFGGLTLLGLAGGLASTFANWIIGPLQELAQAAVTLEAGKIPALLASPVQEVNEVAAALRAGSIELMYRTVSLRESETRLVLAQKTAGLAYVDINFANKIASVSDTFEEILGVNLSAAEFDAGLSMFLKRVHPDDRQHVRQSYHYTIGNPGPFLFDFRVLKSDGLVTWISAQAETLVDSEGMPKRTIITCLDVTYRKKQEEHVRFLLREVSHRSKNQLAIIQAMASQTAKTSRSFEGFKSRFSQRLQGMAASQDLLVNQNWDGVNLDALIRAQLRPFAEEVDGRLTIKGPKILLKPEAAQSLGLALHELATNAAKHGALSASSGKIAISWAIEQDPGAAQFIMTWRESGGPAVAAPSHRGFGHIVIERMVGQALGATVGLTYPPDGLVWSLSTKLDLISE